MAYPIVHPSDIAFFREHGWLVVQDAIELDTLAEVQRRMEPILQKKHKLAFDWAWEKGKSKEEREFKIVQSSPTWIWPEIAQTEFRKWMISFGSVLMGMEMEFWYDQFLAKPPHDGAPTYWHQDEGYWGRNLDDRGITCWMPLQDVDEHNGCMHFIERGHRDGVLTHRQPEHVQSDLLFCEPDLSRMKACPIKGGSVTFHHGKTPHMTPANESDEWRRAVTTHMRRIGSQGEGDHYPWKVYVNQITGERVVPPSR